MRRGGTGGMWMAGLVGWGLLAVPAHAALQQASPGGGDVVDKTMSRYNMHPAFEKLGRGLANTFFGVLEIPLGVHKRYTDTDTMGSFFTGLALGTFRAVSRTGVGLYETVTFFLPYPEHFAPILPTLEYFDESPPRRRLPLE